MMNANPFALGMALVIFGLFNRVFVGGFFKTAYKFAKPFVTYIILCFVVIALAETPHHIPALSAVNAFGFDEAPLQFSLLAAGAAVYALLTLISLRRACKRFEKIDL